MSITKVGVARGITAAFLILKYQKEMRENYRDGDWAEAAKDTGFFAVTMLPVVAPNFFFGSVAFPVLTGAAIGVGVTIVIVEATGIGTAEEVLDLVLDPPTPKEWIEVVAPAIKEEIILPAAEAYVGWVDRRAEEYVGWVDRRIEEAQSVWAVTIPQSPW